MSDRIGTVIAEAIRKHVVVAADDPMLDVARDILTALSAERIAVVELPEPVVAQAFGSECQQWLEGDVSFFPAEGRLELDYLSIPPELAREVAAALLAAADVAEASR